MLAISPCACARRTSRLTRSSMPNSLRPSKRPFMHMSAPSSGAKYTRPMVWAIGGPLGVRPHASSDTGIRKASAPFRVRGIFMEANHSSVYDRVRVPTRIAETSITDAVAWLLRLQLRLPEGENEPDDHIATGVVQNLVERAVERHEPRTTVGRGGCKVPGAGPVDDAIGCSGHQECGHRERRGGGEVRTAGAQATTDATDAGCARATSSAIAPPMLCPTRSRGTDTSVASASRAAGMISSRMADHEAFPRGPGDRP